MNYETALLLYPQSGGGVFISDGDVNFITCNITGNDGDVSQLCGFELFRKPPMGPHSHDGYTLEWRN